MICSEVYRLIRSKYLYISIILAIFSIVGYSLLNFQKQDSFDILTWFNQIYKNYSTTLPLVVFVSGYAVQDFRYGVIRCFVAKGISREKIFFAKFTACIIGATILVLIGGVTGFLTGNILCHYTININDSLLIGGVILTEILLHVAYSALMLLIIIIFEDSFIGVMINVSILMFGFIICKGIKKIFALKWNIQNLWIGSLIEFVQTDNTLVWRMSEIFVGILYIIICLLLGVAVFRKWEAT